MKPKGEQIADYIWLDKTQRSWHVWLGNPFAVGLYRIPLKRMTEAEVIKLAKKVNAREKKRFSKRFKKVKWEVMNAK